MLLDPFHQRCYRPDARRIGRIVDRCPAPAFGVGDLDTERLIAMRQALDEGETQHAPSWDELLDRFGSDAPDGVRLAVVTRIENPEPG